MYINIVGLGRFEIENSKEELTKDLASLGFGIIYSPTLKEAIDRAVNTFFVQQMIAEPVEDYPEDVPPEEREYSLYFELDRVETSVPVEFSPMEDPWGILEITPRNLDL